jgi:hypothetical protein
MLKSRTTAVALRIPRAMTGATPENSSPFMSGPLTDRATLFGWQRTEPDTKRRYEIV